jgi:amino acid permease
MPYPHHNGGEFDSSHYAHDGHDVEKDSKDSTSRYHDGLGGTAAMERVHSITTAGDSDMADIDPNSGVKRGLKTRHLSMMALAGIIGPGL